MWTPLSPGTFRLEWDLMEPLAGRSSLLGLELLKAVRGEEEVEGALRMRRGKVSRSRAHLSLCSWHTK